MRQRAADAAVAGTAAEHAGVLGAWARSGAMALTGRARGAPLAPPHGMIERLAGVGEALAELTASAGRRVDVDPLQLVGERAALARLSRHGSHSCGGSTRLLPARDGWVAVTLAREDDVELIPAWLGADVTGRDPWEVVRARIAALDSATVTDRASLLGLAAAGYRESQVTPVRLPARTGHGQRVALDGLLVVDLSSLWAGPLCSHLLHLAGARVLKVEDVRRPDGARRGPAAFFDLLNAGKESVALDLGTRPGVRALKALLLSADVVIEASRPRALEQLGIDASAMLRAGRARAWVSVTGHGRNGPNRNRVAFGDDAAVAGGLVAWDEHGPCFCADAIADPCTGLVAAASCLEALADGGRHLLDIALSSVAAALAGPSPAAASDDVSTTASGPIRVAPPRARPFRGHAPPLGAHTDAVVREFG